MKKILVFTMPRDKDDFHLANKGADYFYALHDFAIVLRKLKQIKNKAELKNMFYGILSNWDISVWDEVE